MHKGTHYFKVLDSWRGICACMVALTHFTAYNHFYQYPIFWNAGYYVDFFFVLSGFVIFANYQDAFSRGFGVRKFMILRFGRLYPLHLLTLGLFIAHELLQVVLLPLIGSVATYKPFAGPNEGLWPIISNIFLLQSFNTVDGYSLNSPSWSISAEFYTYILFALLLTRAPRKIGLWMPVLLTAGFYFFFALNGKGATHDWGVVRCVYGFAAGGLAWILWHKYAVRVQALLKPDALWTVLEIFAVALCFYLIHMAGKTVLLYVTPFVFMFLVLVFGCERGALSRALERGPMVFIGMLSYSIYMIHAFIAWKVASPLADILQRVFHMNVTTAVEGKMRLGLNMWQGDIVTVVYLAAVIAASYLSYRFFEVPCRNYFKKIAAKF